MKKPVEEKSPIKSLKKSDRDQSPFDEMIKSVLQADHLPEEEGLNFERIGEDNAAMDAPRAANNDQAGERPQSVKAKSRDVENLWDFDYEL